MPEPETTDAGAITHCEWCGVAFDDMTDPRVRTAPAPPPPVPPRAETEPEAATHCEWCGAPYPEPERDL